MSTFTEPLQTQAVLSTFSPSAPMDVERKQSVRIRRYLMAVATYGLAIPLLGIASRLDYISVEGVWHILAIFVLVNGALYAVFRSGLNLRFADPSLTLVQSFLAIATLMYALYLLNAGRELALMMCMVIFVFGMFRLGRRDFLLLTAFALAAYAGVVNFLLAYRPETIETRMAWMSWLVMAAFLPWFAVVGGKISEMRRTMRKSNHDLAGAVEMIRKMTTHDHLTGLANRVLFAEGLQQGLARARRDDTPLSILYIDIFRFKRISDSLGHRAGDAVLVQVAQRIKAAVRAGDTVARVAGDEFVVVADTAMRGDTAAVLARKLIAAFESPIMLNGCDLHIEISIGIVSCPADGVEADALVAKAESAMQRSRQRGPNGFQHYAEEMNLRTAERFELETALRRAIGRDELRVHYQPKIDIATGRLAGAEALMRWQRPVHGLVNPADFIPLAEETGLIVPMGRWLLQKVCSDLRAWQRRSLPAFPVAINLSSHEFGSDTLVQDVLATLERFGLPPRLIEFEITESMVMAEPGRAAAQMHELRRAGIGLALDDFGTGYSSLTYLKHFPLTHLKIDRSFVNGLPRDKGDLAITGAVIGLARSLGLATVAEGVESVEHLACLREMGCSQAQGFHFSRPLPEPEFARFMEPRERFTLEEPDAMLVAA